MGKFSSAGGREMPELNTSSLPDLVFAFLFFIMMVTSMREVSPKISYSNLPQASELTKLEEKSLVTFIYIGKPTEAFRSMYGSSSAIQLNDQVTTDASHVYTYVTQARNKLAVDKQSRQQISIKADRDTKMNIIADVKEELRRANTLNISYSARQGRASQ